VEVDNALQVVNSVLAEFGAAARQLELSTNFTIRLSDELQVGIGNLVDADLARESASLQALQVKQQLGLQALSIANSSPQSILALFGN
jgi:flagellin